MSNARQLLRWVQDNRAATAKRANEATFSSAVQCSILQELEMWDALVERLTPVITPIYADCPECKEPTPFEYGKDDCGGNNPYTCEACGAVLKADIEYAFNGHEEYPVLSIRVVTARQLLREKTR